MKRSTPHSGGEGRSERPRKAGPGSKTSTWSPEGGGPPRAPRAPREGGYDRPREGGFGRPREAGGFDRPREGSSDRPRPAGGTYRREGATGGWNNRGPRTEGAAAPGGRPSFPRANTNIVPARKLKEGISTANRALAELMEDFGQGIAGDYDISSLEATLSFDTDGRFLGFGTGGSAVLTLTLTPLDAENVFNRDDMAGPQAGADDLDELDESADEDDSAEDDSEADDDQNTGS